MASRLCLTLQVHEVQLSYLKEVPFS
uniref:Uncharacterized protein n=1 Tax=Anguilla anguilla TaxID=7936 RepID=A0A0E9W8E1_ANGAN